MNEGKPTGSSTLGLGTEEGAVRGREDRRRDRERGRGIGLEGAFDRRAGSGLARRMVDARVVVVGLSVVE